MEQIFYSWARTAWTPLLVASSARGVVAVQFVPPGEEPKAWQRLQAAFPRRELVESGRQNSRVAEELLAYSSGELQKFTVPLDLRGTAFQKAVWRALLQIPYGETRTYADVARVCGRARAFRAVGMANHSNPIPIIVPCHRVVGSNGRLVGYGGGLALKKTLLEHERRHTPLREFAGGKISLPLWK
jgi:methylated-DNA-[protein]-cysteine S-methyltransferase